MAIYSIHVGSVGKTTHAAGTAGAHVRYISRPSAASDVLAHHMPEEPNAARAWMDRAEDGDRKNARVIDRIRIALPRELTREERFALVRAFCADITGNRTPWFAALHQDGHDAHNPHAHIIVRDRDIETGKRILKWSDSARDRKAAGLPENAVAAIRERWEVLANQALERAGHDARIDRRSLEAQGVDRAPTIHIGPKAARIDDFVHRPESKAVVETRSGRERSIDYPMIDAGRTRKERHAEIVDLNLERAARSPDFATRARAQLLREEMFKDRNLERQLVTEARRATLEERRTRAALRAEKDRIRDLERAQHDRADMLVKQRFKDDRDWQRTEHLAVREALKARQSRLGRKFMRAIDITGATRRREADERKELVAAQIAERRALVAKFKMVRKELHKGVKARHGALIEEAQGRFAGQLQALDERRAAFELRADRMLQARAADRAQAEERLEKQLWEMERARRASEQRVAAGAKAPAPVRPEQAVARAFEQAADPAPRKEFAKEPSRQNDENGFRRFGSRDRDRPRGPTR